MLQTERGTIARLSTRLSPLPGEARFPRTHCISVVALENPRAEDVHGITVADTPGSSFLLHRTLMHSGVLTPWETLTPFPLQEGGHDWTEYIMGILFSLSVIGSQMIM